MHHYKNLIVALLFLSTLGCATKSLHYVQDPNSFSLIGHKVSVSKELKLINWNGQFKSINFYIKNGAGHTVDNYLLVQEQGSDFETSFFGGAKESKKKIKSFSEQINNIRFNSEIYAYDFRFNRGGSLMELIDKSVNRSCGLVKVYTDTKTSLQVSYGKVIGCATLKMSLANYKQYKISELLTELNETATQVFNIEKI
jgi:hypothetical protein